MKFSFRQILASTGGAVIAAIIASTFGVKGTIIGVAIGSAAATIGTAFVAQSIERGHEAVKQVAIKAPDTALLLRRLGGTGASGAATAASDPTQVMGVTSSGDEGAETIEMASSAAPAGETDRVEISAVADAPATERLRATTQQVPATSSSAAARTALGARGFSWQTIAVSAVIVFVLALLLITAIELISGKPLSAIFGGADSGTSVNNLVNPPPASPTTTSTTSTPSSSTTSTTGGSSTSTTTSSTVPTTTSSTAPTGESTTTTSPAPSLTTTTVAGGLGATTTVP